MVDSQRHIEEMGVAADRMLLGARLVLDPELRDDPAARASLLDAPQGPIHPDMPDPSDVKKAATFCAKQALGSIADFLLVAGHEPRRFYFPLLDERSRKTEALVRAALPALVTNAGGVALSLPSLEAIRELPDLSYTANLGWVTVTNTLLVSEKEIISSDIIIDKFSSRMIRAAVGTTVD